MQRDAARLDFAAKQLDSVGFKHRVEFFYQGKGSRKQLTIENTTVLRASELNVVARKSPFSGLQSDDNLGPVLASTGISEITSSRIHHTV
ncbi:hypothetical protein T265_12288 [Opisthorchis viverrini]|uniref:Uncharacterized protein n=1 Tax=Opisthorchis viverrini TaxID=6198 RepID=A0A074YUK6_OPIVI|nr:hypothetical protein T265_12288 [Opisthorchis viverrini]KER18388.1 hypothetical protein T265_12288 [Opisthorchis viverrini]